MRYGRRLVPARVSVYLRPDGAGYRCGPLVCGQKQASRRNHVFEAQAGIARRLAFMRVGQSPHFHPLALMRNDVAALGAVNAVRVGWLQWPRPSDFLR